MRRKVLQDYANVCCQMFLTSLSNYDRINLAIFGSGIIQMNFITMKCTHNKGSISPLYYCATYRKWLENQCIGHHIEFTDICRAEMTVMVDLSLSRKEGLGELICNMALKCTSLIATEEKLYTSEMSDNLCTGFGQIIIDRQY